MKKIMVIICSGVLFLATLSGCQECTICEKGSEPDVRICKNDYNNDSQYRDAITTKEGDGFSCHN
ncbi:MAG: hypothetical protein V4615_15165 [Bacteroidota bacterium]